MTAVSVHVQNAAAEARRLPAAQLWAGLEESSRRVSSALSLVAEGVTPFCFASLFGKEESVRWNCAL